MKKYLLTLCLTMLGFVTSWAQTGHTTWAIEASTAPVYVEVSGSSVGSTSGNPNVLNFKVITPTIDASGNPVTKTFNTDFTVEAVEAAPSGVTTGSIALAHPVTYNSSTGEYSVAFYPATYKADGNLGSVGITKYYLVVKDKSSGSVISSTAATPFEVNVFDKSLARYLINPGDQVVDKGKADNEILISLAPVTAGVTVTTTNKVGNITIPTTPFKAPTAEDIKNNIVRLSVNAENAAVGDHVTVTITPADGSKDRYGNDVKPITFTVRADLPELPVTGASTTNHQFNVGFKFNSPLHTTSFPTGAQYDVQYTYLPVAGYRNDVVSIENATSVAAKLSSDHTGKAQIKATFTPTGETAQEYRAWERILNVTVVPTQIVVGIDGLSGTEDRLTIDAPTISYDPTSFDPTKVTPAPEYDIAYTLEGIIPQSAHIENGTDGKIDVVVDDPTPTQVITLVATLTPKAAFADDYIGSVKKVRIPIGGSGGETGAYLRKQSDGSWVAYLSSPEQTGDNIVAKFKVEGGTLDEFKAATDIKVMGSINSFNIAQLVHAMGVDGTASYSGTLKTVDMSGCLMNGPLEFSHTNAGIEDPIPTFNYPITGVKVPIVDADGNPTGTYDESRVGKHLTLKNVFNFTFPMPDPQNTTLPSDVSAFFGNQYNPADNNLTALTIPEGWTVVPDGFSGKISTNRYRTSAFSKLKDLKLANTIEKIGPYAFADLKAVVLTMPYNIDRIGEFAFSTSLKLQDVYFTGPAPRFVHTQAFSGETQMCNNTVKDQELQGIEDPATARFNYYDQSGENMVLACLLHFPEQYRAQYTDVTREYKRLSKEEVDAHNAKYGTSWDYKYSKGYKTFVPDGWTPTFLAAVRQGVIDPNAYVSNTVDYGMKDAFYGTDMIWPSQSQMSTGYAIAQAGYRWSGQPLGADQYQPGAKYEDTNNSIDRRGLYQFIIALANADIDITFEDGLWYTIALPFNMKPQQIKDVFGPNTQVCRFSKVTRVTVGEDKQIKLEFRKSVMEDQTGDYDGTSYAEELQEAAGEYPGIRHHHAYMIKPSGTKDNQYVTHETLADGTQLWHFKGLDFPRISGTLVPDVVYPNNDNTQPQYSFSPILSAAKIKTYSYILSAEKATPKVHKFFFYKGVQVKDEHGDPVTNEDGNIVYEAGGQAKQNTSYVMCDLTGTMVTPGEAPEWTDWGYEDFKTFFKKTTSSGAAKLVKTFYADDLDDEATAIEKVVIVCGQDQLDNDKIYSISGQQVSGSHLPAGIYIKNGKKILVK